MADTTFERLKVDAAAAAVAGTPSDSDMGAVGTAAAGAGAAAADTHADAVAEDTADESHEGEAPGLRVENGTLAAAVGMVAADIELAGFESAAGKLVGDAAVAAAAAADEADTVAVDSAVCEVERVEAQP